MLVTIMMSVPRWCVNGMSHDMSDMEMTVPLLYQIYQIKMNQVDAGDNEYLFVEKGDVVELVIANGWALNHVSEQHPWHLHGHSFWVLGFGQGEWDEVNG